jgi:hypothetical protein
MSKKVTNPAVNDTIAAILRETGESDPAAAVRVRARELIQFYHATFGENPPFDLKAMASMRGISHCDEAPVHSPDSELLPDEDGRVVMRVNRDRPKTRQRFSIGHEITHTFFPGYEQKVQCRKPRDRDWSDPEDVIEWLCDVGASEFLFPTPWFEESVSECSGTAQGILDLTTPRESLKGTRKDSWSLTFSGVRSATSQNQLTLWLQRSHARKAA